MKRWLGLALVLAAAAGAVWLSVRPRRDSSQSPIRNLSPTPGEPAFPARAERSRDAPDPDFATLQSKDIKAIREVAAAWRRSAREDALFRGRLIRLLSETSTPAEAREVAAFVLGSLKDPEALAALAGALERSSDSDWTRTLLLALGSDRSAGDDDDIFGLADAPRVVATPLGLSIEIRGPMDDESLRGKMLARLRESGAPGVRWAAALALADSTSFQDVRRMFLDALPGEVDPPAQGELAKALADWIAGEGVQTSERAQVFRGLVEGALRPDAGALRLRSEDGLKRMSWTASDVRAVAPWIEAGPFDQRRWAMAVLAGAATRPETPARAEVFDSLRRVIGSESEAKLRELAVTAMSSFPDLPESSPILIDRLGDPAWHVRAAAVRALGRMKRSEESVNTLRRVETDDPDERVRRAAAEVRRLFR